MKNTLSIAALVTLLALAAPAHEANAEPDSVTAGATIYGAAGENVPPDAYYTALLANKDKGEIGMLYETCYSDGTALILVTLNPGIYLQPQQSLVITPKGKHIFVVYYTATTEGPVQNFEGWSSIGCVETTKTLNLDKVTQPPKSKWSKEGYTIWY